MTQAPNPMEVAERLAEWLSMLQPIQDAKGLTLNAASGLSATVHIGGDRNVVVPKLLADLRTAAQLLRTLSERETRLGEALASIKSDAEYTISFYHRNGPTWTGKDGHEYDDMSAVLGRAEEIIAQVDAALSKHEGATP